MIDYIGMLREFHEKYEHHISDKPQRHDTISVEVGDLRDRLIEEEFKEFRNAGTRAEIADALGDLLYVTFGTCLAYGVPIDEIFAEIHRSNMTKSLEKNKHGKTVKGPNWDPPKIKEILERYK